MRQQQIGAAGSRVSLLPPALAWLVTCGALTETAAVAQERPASSAPQDAGDDTDGDHATDIVVKGQRLRANNAFSSTIFDTKAIKDRRLTEVEQIFREVPGMNVRDYNLSGVANQIVIRGFGNGGHGGDLGMVIDGIPLNEANSHADGYVDTNVLVPLEIGAMTVYRGPVSALYGNFNRGGLIAFETRKGGRYWEGDVSGGGFGTGDAQVALGTPLGSKVQLNAAAQAFRTDGFRPQSDAHRITAAARLALALSDRLDLSVSARGQHARSDSPGYLTLAQYRVDPYGIDPRVQNDGSSKDFATLRADLAYSLLPDVRLLAFAYTTQQDFTRFFTRGAAAPTAIWRQREERYDRSVYGVGTSLNGATSLFDRQLGFVIGLEGFSEDTQYQFYDDLNFRRRTAPAQFDRTLKLNSVSAFTEANLVIDPLLQLSLGLRYDRFTGDCTVDGPEQPGGNCGRFRTVDNLSPKAGIRSQITPWLQLRTSYAQGFALPEAQAKFQTGAQGLDPNTIDQVEVGGKLTPTEGLELDAVVYRVDSSDEFASTAPGVFVNFGKTRRRGVEASALWRPSAAVELRAVYAHATSRVRQNLDPLLIGKHVTGVPRDALTIYASVRPLPRLRLQATYRHVGSYAADAANTLFSPAYDIVDVGVSYDLDRWLRVPSRAYLNVDNLFDTVYASTFNSLSSVGTGAPRFVRVGVQLGF
ncbi:TonB-dependent receptor [uncultured Sphingomonas sp.]|uniref:TonB-dependent receptor n=1 Tax=uncultured Sphingomonas sp. TaxID=158754 RepID=UPI0025DB1F0E|nr:TonB-dependent receptor [uncultured Sphingomonas sp.]